MVKDKYTSRGREGVKKIITRCKTCNNCLKPNCETCKNWKHMTKFGGDGKAKQACKGRKCKTEQEDTEQQNSPQTNTKNQEMATVTKTTGETHKKGKHPANTNPAEKMVEANINNKKQDDTKSQTGVNKTPNPINVISNWTEEKRKASNVATANKTRNPGGKQ